jgi:hypothetical protein
MAYIGKEPTAVPLTSADIQDGTISLADLSATGTKDATTFLRGDNSFATVGGSSGTILQVVSGSDSTQRVSTSTSFITNSNTISATITPASTSSKIMILVSGSTFHASGSAEAFYTIFRDATNLGDATYGIIISRNDSSNGGGSLGMSIVDSPNTTSAITYQVYGRSNIGGHNFYFNHQGAKSTITLLEISG